MAAVHSSCHNHFLVFLIFLTFLSLFSLFCLGDGDDSGHKGDDIALLTLKQSLNDPQNVLSSWKKGTKPCELNKEWHGLICTDDGDIQGVHLNDFGLSGLFNARPLATLNSLRTLNLINNSFSGAIPAFNLLADIRNLLISQNKFSGAISSDFFSNMTQLRRLELSFNNFSGPIPASLGQMPNLKELFVASNKFSGPIPKFTQPSLNVLDMSNNNLEGPIPQDLSRFNSKSFDGNEGLCGAQVNKPCDDAPKNQNQNQPLHPAAPAPPQERTDHESGMKWVILAVVISLLLVTVLFKVRRKRNNGFEVLGKERVHDALEMHITSSKRRAMGIGSFSHKSGSSRKRSFSTKNSSDLVLVNEERGVFGLADLMKAAAEVLGNGQLGSAYKATMADGVSVVVKRLREINKLSKDAFGMEISRMARLRHPNILPPLAYHYRKDEKLMVSEYIPNGSLLYILHGDRGTCHSDLNWPMRLRIVQGIASGMDYLHTEYAGYDLPHGNLKSSNILLNSNYEPLLTDYAFYPLFNQTSAAPSLFACKSPEALAYQQLSPKSDVYCLGIVILEILTGKFPSQYLSNQKGGTDVVQWVRSVLSEKREMELIDPEIATHDGSLVQVEKLLLIGYDCTETDHEKRIDMKEAIRRIQEIQIA